MFRVGLIGFGGGNALIPILEQVSVSEQGIVTQEDYEEDVVVASITPGALPVEIAGGIGRRSVGSAGLLLGSASLALPGVILTVLLSSVIAVLSDEVLLQIRFLAVGVSAFICCLLTEYILGSGKRAAKDRMLPGFFFAVGLVFLLTCGKNLYRLIGLNGTPLFSVATVHVFVMAFFLMLYPGRQPAGRSAASEWIIAAALCIVYTLSLGKAQVIPYSSVYAAAAAMTALAVYKWRKNKASAGTQYRIDRADAERTAKEIGWILAFALVSGLIALMIAGKSLIYLWNGFLSSLMSFGGGDAYLTVADGLFVHTGLIAEDDFYAYLVPVVNILPGSILCKTLSGIGYFLGFSQHGSIAEGMLVAAAGFFISLLASCGVFDVIGCLYSGAREQYFVKGIRRWIRPIVSGLMLTVMLSLLYQSRKLGIETGNGWFPAILMALIYIFDLLMIYRFKMKNANVIFLSVLCSFIVLNLA